MMDDKYYKQIASMIILIGLLVLSFLLLKPILISIIIGVMLAFIFYPVYGWLLKKTGWKNISAGILCIFLLGFIILPIWFLTPILIDQSLKLFFSAQQLDLVTPLKTIFPNIFASDAFSAQIGSVLQSFVSRATNSLANSITSLILNFPTIFLQMMVVFFTFFFILRDKDYIMNYIKSMLPYPKDVQKKLFDSSKNITSAVIYGQIIIGMIQGIVLGIGLFLFGINNALLIMLLAIIAGIFPIIGTGLVWIPLMIYLFIAGNNIQAMGILIFGTLSSSLDNFIRPVFVSRRTKLSSSLVLIGMIGGLFLIGVMGLILGPLILAYLLIILDLYRNTGVSIFSSDFNK